MDTSKDWVTPGSRIQCYWRKPTKDHRDAIRAGLNLKGMRNEYSVGIPNPSLIRAEGYTLDAALLSRPGNVDIQLDLFLDYANNFKLYPKLSSLSPREATALARNLGRILPHFIPAGARAFKNDLPDAIVQFLPTGHFALEAHLKDIAVAMRKFLADSLRR